MSPSSANGIWENGCMRSDLAIGRYVKRFAEDIFFHLGATVLIEFLRCAFVESLVLRPDAHCDIQESLVKEWDTGLEAPSHRRPRGVRHGAAASCYATYLLARRQSAVCKFLTLRTHS